jgi:hypothetical protein
MNKLDSYAPPLVKDKKSIAAPMLFLLWVLAKIAFHRLHCAPHGGQGGSQDSPRQRKM